MAIQQGATWTRSSYSGGNGACVEVMSPARDVLAVRDSKVDAGARLCFGAGAWSAFIGRDGVVDADGRAHYGA